MFSYLRRMDWAMNGAVLVLGIFGMLAIASAEPREVVQQGVWFTLGIVAMAVGAGIDWRPLITRRWVMLTIYSAGVGLLVLTYFLAPHIRGIRSWLVIGPVQFQTSEVAKISLILLFSYYFAHRHVGIAEWRNSIIPFFYMLVPVGLTILQPDMGSALIMAGLWVIYLLVSGIKWRHIAVGILILGIGGLWGWGHLADYQRARVRGLFDPSYDPLGINYNVIQSKIAIGSGGWLGKGWKEGTQVQLGFLPEAANDFIFSTIVEEWGMVGGLALLAAFMVLVARILTIGVRAENNFSKLVCLGTSGLFALHLMLNIGSAVGLVPVVGVPLPFVSYGGSNLLTSFMLLGIVQSIAIRSMF